MRVELARDWAHAPGFTVQSSGRTATRLRPGSRAGREAGCRAPGQLICVRVLTIAEADKASLLMLASLANMMQPLQLSSRR